MSSALDSTYGIWLVSVFLESILYGMGILQTFLYFQWYPEDNKMLKATVVFLAITETLQLALMYYATYFYVIMNFANPAALLVIIWQDSIQLFLCYLSALIVQLYFAYSIYKFQKVTSGRKILAIISIVAIIALVLVEFGAGLAQTVITERLGSFTKLQSTASITSLQSASALACDVIITFTLVMILDGNRSGMSSTNSMLNTLIKYAINRGALTSACALINLVLFVSVPGTFWFFIGLVLSSKLYMNSMLATLNTRHYIIEKGAANWNSVGSSTAASRPYTSSGKHGEVRSRGPFELGDINQSRTMISSVQGQKVNLDQNSGVVVSVMTEDDKHRNMV
jgi:hypothetical protein